MAHGNTISSRSRGVKSVGTETEVFSRMSHDFRTPLNIIIGFTELMLDEVPGKINEEQRRSLTDILNSARRMLELVNNLPEQA